jgi:energy-coupling factor transport system ATP-binding protein
MKVTQSLNGGYSIEFRNVSYRYPNCTENVLKSFNIQIPEGKIWLIIGPTGSGKSTFISLARGLHKIFGGDLKGDIFLKGKNIGKIDFYSITRMGIGWVGQDPSVNLHQLTVRDEILSSPIYFNLPWEECENLFEKVVSDFDIEHLLDKSPMELSGGEMQKVAIASALTMSNYSKNGTGILLLDEPDSFLDPKAAKDLNNLLLKLKKQGHTIIIVSHRISHYIDIVDGMTLINEGRNIISGNPLDVIYNDLIEKTMGIPLSIQISKELRKKGIINNFPITNNELLNSINITAGNNKIEIKKNTGSPAIICDNLFFDYNSGKDVISNLNLTIPKGSITALIGKNGVGKSTLAKLLLGLLSPSKGNILIENKKISEYSRNELAKTVSYITQNPKDMFITETPLKECELSPKLLGLRNYKELAENSIKKADLEKVKNNSIDSLSGGQNRLLTLACTAFSLDSSILIIDEPEYGIDPKHWEEIFSFFREIKSKNKTVILITHFLEISLFCDFVIIMDNGKILKFDHPANIFSDKNLLEELDIDMPTLFPIFYKLWKKHIEIEDTESLVNELAKEL